MPETPAQAVKPKTILCSFCLSLCPKQQFQRHLRDAHGEKISDGYRMCTRCQFILPLCDFPRKLQNRSKESGGADYTCKACHSRAMKEWNTANRPKKPPRPRPGRWVLHACPFCGEMFSARQILRHKPRCLNGHAGARISADFTVPEHMQETKNESMKQASRRAKDHNLMYFYGIDHAEYDRMNDSQGGLCAICHQPPRGGGPRKILHLCVDHDHATGKVRGLLCYHCNRALGCLKEDPSLFDAAKAYLLAHQPETVLP